RRHHHHPLRHARAQRHGPVPPGHGRHRPGARTSPPGRRTTPEDGRPPGRTPRLRPAHRRGPARGPRLDLDPAVTRKRRTVMQTYRIVVGFDGSDGGVRALSWAVAEAAERGGAVQAVTAWQRAEPELGAEVRAEHYRTARVSLEGAIIAARDAHPG